MNKTVKHCIASFIYIIDTEEHNAIIHECEIIFLSQ